MSFLIQQTLIYAVPLMIVALAGVFAERSGIINLALEGIMIFGAFIGVLFVRQMQGVDTFIAAKAAGDWGTLQGLVLLAMLIAKWTGLDIDGWVGLVVAGFILFSGVKSARETISPLLGQPPEKEFVDRIQAIVLSHPEILGLHDLVVHDYGPGRVMVSLHAEVPAHGDLLELHDVVDNIEMDLSRQLNCQAVIHMDPVVTDDGLTGPLRSRVAELVKQVDPAITIHDFRVVAGPTHTNLVFDAVVPFDEKLTAAQAAEKIRALVRTMDDGRYFAVVTVENSYI